MGFRLLVLQRHDFISVKFCFEIYNGYWGATEQLRRFTTSEDIMTSTGDNELRAVIKFCHDLDLNQHRLLENFRERVGNAADHWCLSGMVFFTKGTSITDDPRNGRPAWNRTSRT